MTDSPERDALTAKHERNRERRLESVKRWVEYIREHPAEVWGPQQNRLINAQIDAAQASDLDVDHRKRVADVGNEQ